MRRFVPLLVFVSTCLVAFPSLAESPIDGHWQGKIELPTGDLIIDVDFSSTADGTLEGDISIPVQGLQDADLEGIEYRDGSLEFALPGIPGNPRFDGSLDADGDTLSGTFYQGPAELAFELEKGRDPKAVAAAALEGFDTLIEQSVDDFTVPGIGLAIVYGDEVVYAEGFGHRDIEQDLPMTADTLFAIGSTTKAMTATVLGMQADDELVDLDTPVTRYLPTFRLEDPSISSRVTPRDLLTHRSGLPRHDLVWYNNNSISRAELVERLPHLQMSADLRQKFQYNNLLFAAAGHLTGVVEDATWEEVMERRLFGPLKMERSNFSVLTSQQDADHALPYRKGDDDQLTRIPFRRIDLIGPAGSVNSSVREMANWLRLNLADGTFDGERLIEASTLADIHAPHMTTEAPPFEETQITQIAYGLGWSIEVYRGLRRIRHNGGIDGFSTSVMLFPDRDLGLVAFTNRGSGMAMLALQHAADRILGLDPIDWMGQALAKANLQDAAAEEAAKDTKEDRMADTAPSRPLDAYVGHYRHDGYGDLQVTLHDAMLSWTFNGIETPLEHWHYDVWQGSEEAVDPTFEGTKVQFRAGFDGHIQELVVIMEARADPIVFSKQADPNMSRTDTLQAYAGEYRAAGGQEAEVVLNGQRLTLTLPGQPLYTLQPLASGRFGIEGLQGFTVGFEEDDGAVTAIVFYQPNGVFNYARVDD